MVKRTWWIAALMLLNGMMVAGTSAGATPCPTIQQNVGAMVVNRFLTLSYGCLLQVTPLDKPNLIYREYWFSDAGRLLVFDSQTGDPDTATATRSYFLFPRLQEPSYSVSADERQINVTLSTGQHVFLATDTPRILSFPGVEYQEPQSTGLQAADFLTIVQNPELTLDTGWKIGGEAYLDPQSPSTFRDGGGQTCTVKNSEIFIYATPYGEPVLAFGDDQKLESFLHRRCPNLNWTAPAS